MSPGYDVHRRLACVDRRTTCVCTDVAPHLGANHDLDLETLDTLAEPTDALAAEGVELRLAAVHAPVLELLRRGGLADRVRIEPTLDAATDAGRR